MILGLQIMAILFSLVMIYFAILNYKRKELNKAEIFSWLIIWSVTIFITSFPEILRKFAGLFAVSRLFDLMVVGGFILVIAMVAVAYVRTKRVEKKLEDYVRKDALKGLGKKK